MTTVNALKVRNKFGEVLQTLEETGAPILIEKRKQVRAVLISYDDFKTRFIDRLAQDERDRFMTRVASHSKPSTIASDPLDTLRSLRGHAD